MSNQNLNEDFEEVKKQISDKMVEARKLIQEANELASRKLHCTLYGAAEDAFENLQGVMDDVGLVTEREWNSSGCSF